MKYECSIIHTMNNEVLISINNCIGIHNKIYDESDNSIGKITRVLGPVSHPYALAYLAKKDMDINKIYVKC